MVQAADKRPIPSVFRKSMIAVGGARDHAGQVQIRAIENFDLNRTIFNTLEGKLPRFLIKRRIAKECEWNSASASFIDERYKQARAAHKLPTVSPKLLRFLVDECDFDVEHADGSFLDHLYFGFEYSVQHFPEHSPLVMLLHSVLGTGTNTFAMTAEKIPALQALVSEFEWAHVEAFPSILRLLYDMPLRQELHANARKAEKLQSIRFRRVIDNAPIEMTGEDFWIALNYQLIHLLDFLPVANWATHQSDTSFVLFRDLYGLLHNSGQLMAHIDYTPSSGNRTTTGENPDIADKLIARLPSKLTERLAAKSVRRFSQQIGHDIGYQITWG